MSHVAAASCCMSQQQVVACRSSKPLLVAASAIFSSFSSLRSVRAWARERGRRKPAGMREETDGRSRQKAVQRVDQGRPHLLSQFSCAQSVSACSSRLGAYARRTRSILTRPWPLISSILCCFPALYAVFLHSSIPYPQSLHQPAASVRTPTTQTPSTHADLRITAVDHICCEYHMHRRHW